MPIGAFDLHSFWSFCCCGFGLSFKVLYILTFNCIIFHLCLAQCHEDIFKGRHAKGIVRNSQFILRFFQCNQELGKVTHIIQIHCNTCHWSILQLLFLFPKRYSNLSKALRFWQFDVLVFFCMGEKKKTTRIRWCMFSNIAEAPFWRTTSVLFIFQSGRLHVFLVIHNGGLSQRVSQSMLQRSEWFDSGISQRKLHLWNLIDWCLTGGLLTFLFFWGGFFWGGNIETA